MTIKAQLLRAITLNNTNDAKEILASQQIDFTDEIIENTRILYRALANNNTEIAKILIQKGLVIDHSFVTNSGSSLLHVIDDEFSELFPLLTENINQIDQYGCTPLHYAIADKPKLVEHLLKSGANIEIQDDDLNSPLHGSVRTRTLEGYKIAIKLSSVKQINAIGDSGKTALYMAVEYNNMALCKLLIEKGANVNIEQDDYNTPLHVAANAGNTEICNLLIEAGANLNAKNIDGRTPKDVCRADLLKHVTQMEEQVAQLSDYFMQNDDENFFQAEISSSVSRNTVYKEYYKTTHKRFPSINNFKAFFEQSTDQSNVKFWPLILDIPYKILQREAQILNCNNGNKLLTDMYYNIFKTITMYDYQNQNIGQDNTSITNNIKTGVRSTVFDNKSIVALIMQYLNTDDITQILSLPVEDILFYDENPNQIDDDDDDMSIAGASYYISDES